LQKEYDKADVVQRVTRYGGKSLYEDLKLKEIEIRKML